MRHGSILRSIGLVLGFIALQIVAWIPLRARAEDLGTRRYSDGLEQLVFRTSPTLWLQEQLAPLPANGLSMMTAVIHASWFFVPWIVVIAIMIKRPGRLSSLFAWWLALEAISLAIFALFPMEPPWMAQSEILRLNSAVFGQTDDPNKLAAMPSLHVALPLVMALWLVREDLPRAGLALAAYALLIAVEVVISGEHYVVDVLGAVLVTGLVARLARVDYKGLYGLLAHRLARLSFRQERPVRQPMLAVGRSARSERAQALIEFAFIAPLMLLILLIIVDFAVAIDRRVMLQHAVREGARYGAVHQTCPDIVTRTLEHAQDMDGVDVTVSYPDGNDVGERVRVAASFTWEFPIAKEISNAFGIGLVSLDLTPSGTSRLERSADSDTWTEPDGCTGSSS